MSNSKKRKPISEKQVESDKKVNRIFKNKIKKLFLSAGFQQIKTENHHFKIGYRKAEIDCLFIYENILIVCEDTSTTSNIKDHIRKKYEAFDQINKNKGDFLAWIKKEFYYNDIEKYSENQYLIKYLYFSQNELNFSKEEAGLYPLIKFVEPSYLEYFNRKD